MSDSNTLDTILTTVLSIQKDMGDVRSATASAHKRLDKHDGDIDGLKTSKWATSGLITLVATGVTAFIQWVEHKMGGG